MSSGADSSNPTSAPAHITPNPSPTSPQGMFNKLSYTGRRKREEKGPNDIYWAESWFVWHQDFCNLEIIMDNYVVCILLKNIFNLSLGISMPQA